MNVLSHHDIVEGGNLSVTCQVTHGNPSSTSIFWSKEGTAGFKLERPTLQLPNIQRNSSGTYRCIAENTYSNEEKGTDSQTMVVNVQCKFLYGIDLYLIILSVHSKVFPKYNLKENTEPNF